MVEVKKDVFVFLFHHCAKLGELGVVRQAHHGQFGWIKQKSYPISG